MPTTLIPSTLSGPRTLSFVRDAQSGDQRALERLFHRIRPNIAVFVASQLPKSELDSVEDVTQETLVSAFRQLDRIEIRERLELYSWLRTLAKNRILDHLRRKGSQRRSPPGQMESVHDLIEERRASPPTEVSIRDERDRVARAIAQLDERHREALVLRDFSGASWEEVAQSLGLQRADAARSLVLRARQRLRDYLAGAAQPVTHWKSVVSEWKAPPVRIHAGTRIDEFEIVRRIGRGGMGIVYEALDTTVGRSVALKVVTAPVPAAHPEALTALDHPNIARIRRTGTTADGLPYVAMDLIDGRSLAQHLASANAADPDHLRFVVDVMFKIADAVQAAHDQGIVHGDIKPGNILLDGSGEPFLADFGLARLLANEPRREGPVAGTPCYMAPELLVASADFGIATDVYALGATLYHCLALTTPYFGHTREDVAQEITAAGPPDPRAANPSTPDALELISRTAMHRDPAYRYGTAELLQGDLARWRRTSATRTGIRAIEFRVGQTVAEFDARVFQRRLAALTGVLESEARIVSIREGSAIITMNGDVDSLERMIAVLQETHAAIQRRLDELQIEAITITLPSGESEVIRSRVAVASLEQQTPACATNISNRRFRVALSFPTQHMDFVERVAEALAQEFSRELVFFYPWHTAHTTRLELDKFLARVYGNESDVIAMFLSAHYRNSEWCGLEWAALRDLRRRGRGGDVMPFRFDRTHIPGMFHSDGYLDIDPQRGPEHVAELIIHRAGEANVDRPAGAG